MTPLEAMQRLIGLADHYRIEEGGRADLEAQADDNLAVAVITAMLNTALPIAKFRCFVQVDADSKRRGKIRDEYTICAPSIHGILAGLIGLGQVMTDVHATLWEQKAEGASMLSGYQGPSKTGRYRSWLQSLTQFEYVEPEAVPDATN